MATILQTSNAFFKENVNFDLFKILPKLVAQG